ncbi:MAG: transporter associated domain-containing protein, partial [Pseudomonadota bacterium]
DLDDRQADAITKILESPYTRLPLYKSDHETIVGVLHARALLRAIGSNHLGGSNPSLAGKARPPIDLEKIAAKPWFIPETTSLLDQLQEFRERREHFALVVDEYGSFQGIVTLEDILEQIVGNIHDELDTPAKGIWPQHDGSYVIDGAKSLRELNRELDWQFPEDQAATLAGLILDEARMIPMPKQVFTFHAMRFEVLAREHNRLTRIRVTPLGTSTPAEPIQNTQQTGIGPRP